MSIFFNSFHIQIIFITFIFFIPLLRVLNNFLLTIYILLKPLFLRVIQYTYLKVQTSTNLISIISVFINIINLLNST